MLCDLKIITLCLYLYLTQYPNYYRIIFFYNFSIGTPSGIYGCLNALVRLFSTETIRKGGGGHLSCHWVLWPHTLQHSLWRCSYRLVIQELPRVTFRIDCIDVGTCCNSRLEYKEGFTVKITGNADWWRESLIPTLYLTCLLIIKNVELINTLVTTNTGCEYTNRWGSV